MIAGTQAARIAAAKGTVIDISEANKSTTVSAWTEYAKTGRYVAGLPFPDAARKQPSLVSDQANQSVTPAQENQKRKFLSIIAMLALLLAGYVGWHSLNSTPVASSRSTSDPSADSAAASANSSTQHAKKLEETRIDQEPSESLNKSGTSHSNPKDFEGHEIQPDSSSPTENTPEYANAPNDGMNSGQLNQPDIGKPAKIVDSDEAAIAHSGPTANLLALENQLDNAHDLDSYAEALLQYSLAVTDPQAKKELQKTLSARRHWKAALAGNTLIKEVNALDQPSEQDLKRLTQLHATLAKDSDDNPQVTAIEQFLASRHAKQDSMEDADFSFLSEMPFANLITIESLVDENQGRMFMLADSTISTDALKTKRDTITLDIVKDVSGTTEERAINTPLRIRDEPRASIEWLIANTPPENVDFTKQWDKTSLVWLPRSCSVQDWTCDQGRTCLSSAAKGGRSQPVSESGASNDTEPTNHTKRKTQALGKYKDIFFCDRTRSSRRARTDVKASAQTATNKHRVSNQHCDSLPSVGRFRLA